MKFDQTTKILLGCFTAGIWAVVIILLLPHARINKIAEAQQVKQTAPKKYHVDYNTLTVHRLNVVNKKGNCSG